MIHVDSICHMESDHDEIFTLHDFAKRPWFSCSNNGWLMSEKTSRLLKSIRDETRFYGYRPYRDNVRGYIGDI